MWEGRNDNSGAGCNSSWTNSISNLQNKWSYLSKYKRKKDYIKANHSELKESTNTETEKELLKRDIGSNLQLNLFQEIIFFWALSAPTISGAGLWVCTHPGCFSREWIPSSATTGSQSCEHPSFHPSQHRQTLGDRQHGHQGLSKCPRGAGDYTKFPLCLQTEPGGKASTPPLVRSHILQELGSATAKTLCGKTAQPRAHNLQAMPAANGICPRPAICPWLCPRLWSNPLQGVCQQQSKDHRLLEPTAAQAERM